MRSLEGRRRYAVGIVMVAFVIAAIPLTGWSTGAGGKIRTYYIAIDEVAWDYAPSGSNEITGDAFGDMENVFVARGPGRIGSVYVKALYREYTDGTFSTPKPVPPEWQHLGTLGPAIRAEVGDTIKVYARNNARFPFSFHPHGVFYLKDSEGAGYDDGTGPGPEIDDAIPPGGMVPYTWQVPERAGPGPGDGSSVLWMYHSHVDEAGDTNAGLVGPIIIYRKGATTGSNLKPSDIDREFVTMFTVFDENRSPYMDRNIATYVGGQYASSVTQREALKADEDFHESNLMHSINGYVYGNLPLETLTMYQGERVRWYVMGMGTEVDLHTPHWHGQSLTWMGMRTDVIELMPASMKTLEMVPDNPGIWLYHCHVNDHLDAGMIARFQVLP